MTSGIDADHKGLPNIWMNPYVMFGNIIQTVMSKVEFIIILKSLDIIFKDLFLQFYVFI